MSNALHNHFRRLAVLLLSLTLVLHVQASVACTMMPDDPPVSGECCCEGMQVRHDIEIETQADASSSPPTPSLSRGDIAENPHEDCCILQLSLRVDSSSDSGSDNTPPLAKDQKTVKLSDKAPLFSFVEYDGIGAVEVQRGISVTSSPYHSEFIFPPIYKSTQRYRL